MSTPIAAPTLPTEPVWIGSTDIEEVAESPVIELTKDGETWVKTFKGPFATLKGAMPARFSTMSDTGSLLVDTVKVSNGPGGVGTMVVTLVPLPSPGVTEADPVEEVEWVEVSRPLKSHKMFQHDGAYELELTDLAAIQIWQNQTDPVAMAAFQYYKDGDAPGSPSGTLTTNAQYYATKWLRGQEQYNEFAPVYRSTHTLGTPPSSGGCGVIGAPVSTETPVPPYYQWLKNADRVLKRSKTWERMQEWLGAWWWDPDVYSTATTGATDGGGGSDG